MIKHNSNSQQTLGLILNNCSLDDNCAEGQGYIMGIVENKALELLMTYRQCTEKRLAPENCIIDNATALCKVSKENCCYNVLYEKLPAIRNLLSIKYDF